MPKALRPAVLLTAGATSTPSAELERIDAADQRTRADFEKRITAPAAPGPN